MGNKRCRICQDVQKNGEKGYFGFPSMKQKFTREKWLQVCEIPADTDTKKMSVCFRHFQAIDIEEYPNYIRLKKGMYDFKTICSVLNDKDVCFGKRHDKKIEVKAFFCNI